MRKNRFIWLAVDSNGDEKLTSNPEGFQRFSPAAYHDKYGDYDKCRKERNKVISRWRIQSNIRRLSTRSHR